MRQERGVGLTGCFGFQTRKGLSAWRRLVLLLILLVPSAALGLEEGDPAPDFILSGSDGKLYSLQGLLEEHSGVVLAFFPRAFTPG